MIPGFYDNSHGIDARAYKRKGVNDSHNSVRKTYDFGNLATQMISDGRTPKNQNQNIPSSKTSVFKSRHFSLPNLNSSQAADLAKTRALKDRYNPITNPIVDYENPDYFRRKMSVFKDTQS